MFGNLIAGQAALLSGNSSVSGLVWTSVDNSCRLHYSIRIEGADTDTLESTLGMYTSSSYVVFIPMYSMGEKLCKMCAGLVNVWWESLWVQYINGENCVGSLMVSKLLDLWEYIFFNGESNVGSLIGFELWGFCWIFDSIYLSLLVFEWCGHC